MLKSYFKIAWRNLTKNKLYQFHQYRRLGCRTLEFHGYPSVYKL
jgi:hypothetical protein